MNIYLDDNIHDALEKVAEKQEYAGFGDTQRASMRVMGRKKKGGGSRLVASKEDINRRLRAQLIPTAVGMPIGAAVGLLARKKMGLPPDAAGKALAAIIGGTLTGTVAGSVGQQRSDLKRLRGAGVNAKWHGLSSTMTPSTRKRLGLGKKKS